MPCLCFIRVATMNGERNFAENIHVIGDGDALQVNGSAYWLNCIIDGGGDTVLGRGPSSAVLLEFNSHDKEGKAIDVSKRNKYVRQLHAIKDAEVIGKYSDASWVLNW